MRLPLIAALSVCLCAGAIANAQLGRLKNKLKEAVKKEAGPAKGQDVQKATPGSTARPGVKKGKDRQYPPGVSFATVLNGVVLRPENGQFRLDNIQGTFIPDDCKEGCMVLRKADGTELYQYNWKPDRLKKPYCILSVNKITDLRTGEDVATFADMSEPGEYVLDFYLPDELFYTFPFTVRKVGGDDPFGDGNAYVLDGDWQTCAYLYYVDAKPDQSLYWKVWLRSGKAGTLDAKVTVEIKRDADGELVCTGRGSTSYSFRPDWVRYEFDTVFPEGKPTPAGTYFKAKDLLATDGAYTLTMAINGEKYGEWKFEIKDNKLQYKGRAVRGEADTTTFMEGGRDAWWYVKE
ncbi:MAG: hypothetical protein PVJ57_21535 [Phycisphaerae bacterium]|jgi:hypothetical protein